MTAPITTVTVTYNSRDTIGAMLGALRPSVDAGLVEPIIVDNASPDDTASLVRQQYPWARLIESGGNVGFAHGCNLGGEAASGDYLLLLNPDAAIEVDDMRTLLSFMSARSKVGAVGPALRESDGTWQRAGMMPTPTTVLRAAARSRRAYRNAKPIMPGDKAFRTTWLCGAALLVRMSLWRKVGGFDPRFFLYFDEADFFRRAAKTGATFWAVGEAQARHVAGASAQLEGKSMVDGCLAEHYFRSRFYYLCKHFGRPAAVATEMIEYALLGARSLANRTVGRRDRTGFDIRRRAPFARMPV